MKTTQLIWFILFWILPSNLFGQCAATGYQYEGILNFSSNIQTVQAQSYPTAKPAWGFFAAQNVSYTITCSGQYSHSQISIYNSALVGIAHVYNPVIGSATINWECPASGLYYFMVSDYNCQILTQAETIEYQTNKNGDNYWMGLSTHWSDLNNWSQKSVPTWSDNVYIGVANSDCELDQTASVHDIFIDSGGIFNSESETLNVYRNWSNWGVHLDDESTIRFVGSENASITREGTAVIVFQENFETANALWSLQSITNHTEWRIQNDPLIVGNHDCALYNLFESQAHDYYTSGGNTYLSLSTNVDLKDYSQATLSFDWRNGADHKSNTLAVLGGQTLLSNFDNQTAWQSSGSIDISSHCGQIDKELYFRAWVGPATSAGGSPGLCIDNVVITGVPNVESFGYLVISKDSAQVDLISSVKVEKNLTIASGDFDLNAKNIECLGQITSFGEIFSDEGSSILISGIVSQTFWSSHSIELDNLIKSSPSKLSFDGETTFAIEHFTWLNNLDTIEIGTSSATTTSFDDNFYIDNDKAVILGESAELMVGGNFRNMGKFDVTESNSTLSFFGSESSYLFTNAGDTIFADNFESDPFASASDWNITDDATGRSEFRWTNGFQYDGLYDLAVWDEMDGGYPYDYMWDSPGDWCQAEIELDLSAYTGAFLEFYWRCGGADSINATCYGDYGQVLVNGQAISERLWNQQSYIKHEPISLAEFCGGMATITFRFVQDGLYSGNGGAAVSPGLCIDNIVVFANSSQALMVQNLKVDKDLSDDQTILACPIEVLNSVSIEKGRFDAAGNSIEIDKNWYCDEQASFLGRNNTVSFIGLDSSYIDCGLSAFDHLYLNKSNSVVWLGGHALDVNGNLHIGTQTLFDSQSQNIELMGNWTNLGQFACRQNWVIFDGQSIINNSGTASSKSFYHLLLDGISATQTDTIVIKGNFKIENGTWDVTASNYPIWVYGNWENNSLFNQRNGSVFLLGNHSTIYAGADSAFYNLYIQKTTDNLQVALASNFGIEHSLNMISGDVDLQGFNIHLGEFGLVQSENNENRIFDGAADGKIIATNRLINIGTYPNIAGLGLDIDANQSLGLTEIRRGHSTALVTAGGLESLPKYFDVLPTVNTGLDATLTFNFFDSDCSACDELGLTLWRSTDMGLTWTNRHGTPNALLNQVELSGIDAFSRWTLANEWLILALNDVGLVAECKEDKVNLKWNLNYQNQSSYYNIESSLDGNIFQVLDSVLHISDVYEYEYTLKKSKVQEKYFRLSTKDLNRNLSSSEMVYLDCRSKEPYQIQSIVMQENAINIDLISEKGIKNILFFNYLAQSFPIDIQSQNTLYQIQINTFELSSGIYLIKMEFDDGSIQSIKLPVNF